MTRQDILYHKIEFINLVVLVNFNGNRTIYWTLDRLKIENQPEFKNMSNLQKDVLIMRVHPN